MTLHWYHLHVGDGVGGGMELNENKRVGEMEKKARKVLEEIGVNGKKKKVLEFFYIHDLQFAPKLRFCHCCVITRPPTLRELYLTSTIRLVKSPSY